MKKWTDLSCLALLDDVAALDPPSRAWEDLARTATREQPKVVASAARVAAPAPERAESRVFSSRPTLRQLMQEYNRRTARTAPIKSSDLAASRHTFRFQSVDLIPISTIPGKILRPAPARDRDAES